MPLPSLLIITLICRGTKAVKFCLLLLLPYQRSLLASAMKQHSAQLLVIHTAFLFFFSKSHFYCGLSAVLLLLMTTECDPAWVITEVNIMAHCEGESSMCCSAEGVAPAKIITEITQLIHGFIKTVVCVCVCMCARKCVLSNLQWHKIRYPKPWWARNLFWLYSYFLWWRLPFTHENQGFHSQVSMVTETSVNRLLTPWSLSFSLSPCRSRRQCQGIVW